MCTLKIKPITCDQYESGLEGNLEDLHGRVPRGAYRAKPPRRRQRPLGIAALEDKIVQRAVVEILNATYEMDLLGFSYGFWPGRIRTKRWMRWRPRSTGRR